MWPSRHTPPRKQGRDSQSSIDCAHDPPVQPAWHVQLDPSPLVQLPNTHPDDAEHGGVAIAHVTPSQPEAHTQCHISMPSTHEPPGAQGVDAHSSTLSQQVAPPNPDQRAQQRESTTCATEQN